MNDILDSIQLPVFSVSIEAKVTREVRWNSFPGSVIHGVLGFNLKNLSCVVPHRNCKKCYLIHSCPYGTVYESPLPPDTKRMRLYPQAPHPLRIAVYPWHKPVLKTGDTFEVIIVLFGRAVTNSLLVLLSLEAGLREGVGRKYKGERGRADLAALKDRISGAEEKWCIVKEDYPNSVCSASLRNLQHPRPARDVTLLFKSPLKVITDGKPNFDPNVRDMVSSLLRRVSNLSYFYNGKEVPFEYENLLSTAESLHYSSEFKKVGAIRYSSRQSKTISMGGITGKMAIKDCDPEISALLGMGAHVGLGKGTTMGLGDYSVE